MKLSTLCFDRVNYLRGITGKQVLYFPDFIDEGIDSQVIENSKFEQWGSTETEKLTILLIGSLAKRKGLLTLLRCALLLKEDERIQFQIAGSLQEPNFAPEEKTFFDYCVSNSESLNIRFHLGRIETESEMNYLISRADILYGLYEDFNFSSNMLGKSAFFDTPLLASKDLYIGRVTEEFDLGWAIDSRDPEALREFLLSKLRLKLQNNQIRLSYGDQKKKSMFVMSNSADALTETLSKIFE